MTETNAERLGRLKPKSFQKNGDKVIRAILNPDYKFLIEQAERAQELEGIIKHSQMQHELNYFGQEKRTEQLKDENKRLREAINQSLEKYKWNNEESARILEQALEGSP